MTEPPPLGEPNELTKRFASELADGFGAALERLLDTPDGEDKFVAYLERKAAERRAKPLEGLGEG